MPTQIPVERARSPRLSAKVVVLHALLAAAIIGTIVVTVVWAYT